MYVVDASVLVADARPAEPHHADARGLLGLLANRALPLVVPTIALAEVAAALARGTGQPALARRWVAALRTFPHIQITAVDAALGDLAADLAAQQRLRGCDAVYVALAQREQAPLITLDREQQSRVPASVTAYTPARELARLTQRP